MKCSVCNKKINKRMAYCSKCGAVIYKDNNKNLRPKRQVFKNILLVLLTFCAITSLFLTYVMFKFDFDEYVKMMFNNKALLIITIITVFLPVIIGALVSVFGPVIIIIFDILCIIISMLTIKNITPKKKKYLIFLLIIFVVSLIIGVMLLAISMS